MQSERQTDEVRPIQATAVTQLLQPAFQCLSDQFLAEIIHRELARICSSLHLWQYGEKEINICGFEKSARFTLLEDRLYYQCQWLGSNKIVAAEMISRPTIGEISTFREQIADCLQALMD